MWNGHPDSSLDDCGCRNTAERYDQRFEKVKTAAATFVQWANNQTEEQSEETELEVEAALPQKRCRKKKTMPGEMSKDEAVTDAETSYKIDVHNQIMDTVTGSMHQRFLKNGTMYADLALLDPKRFSQMLDSDQIIDGVAEKSELLQKLLIQ
ncbi:hypothetical protein JOQ06_011930 [Pogonophryne albipinna]|uniref:Uncharacterized protein n=1 Tax=Pogonophryne albipinna TaxID=1090488 RepID=A0AAD6BEH8_9TELE|nr:hypothetical protein JOQ06_011930 [Pogonophryne albipinna]